MDLKFKPGDIIERDGHQIEIVRVYVSGYSAIHRESRKEYDNSLDPFFANGWRLARKKSDAA